MHSSITNQNSKARFMHLSLSVDLIANREPWVDGMSVKAWEPLLAHTWGKKRSIHTFAKDISEKWMRLSLPIPLSAQVIAYSVSYYRNIKTDINHRKCLQSMYCMIKLNLNWKHCWNHVDCLFIGMEKYKMLVMQ